MNEAAGAIAILNEIRETTALPLRGARSFSPNVLVSPILSPRPFARMSLVARCRIKGFLARP